MNACAQPAFDRIGQTDTVKTRLASTAIGAIGLAALLTGCFGGTEQRTVEPPTPAVAVSHVEGTIDPAWLATTSADTGIGQRVLAGYASADLAINNENPECAMRWNILAGVGHIESAHGRVNGATVEQDGTARPAIIGIALDGDGVAAIEDTDGGLLDGDTTWDRAVGPMQFIPETWARWGEGDPQNIDHAALAAARYLCASGERVDTAAGWTQAILTYNRSYDYAERVTAAADGYATAIGPTPNE